MKNTIAIMFQAFALCTAVQTTDNRLTGFYTISGSYYGTGILCTNPLALSSNLKIRRNNIINLRYGIVTGNVESAVIGHPDDIGASAQTINYNLTAAPTDHYSGIWVQYGDKTKIVNNVIINSTAFVSTDLFRGIDVVASIRAHINCNTIDKVCRSIFFTGDCSNSKLHTNHMKNFENGVELFDNNTILSPQGDYDASINDYHPYNNEWIPYGNSVDRVHRGGAGVPNLILWYHDGQAQHLPTPSNTVISQQGSNVCHCDCDDYTILADREESIGRVINDSIPFEDNPLENAYQAKMNVHKQMKEDSSLIYTGAPDDYIYEDFYAAMNNGNMGLLDSINGVINDSNGVQSAIALNDAVIDTNNIEYYLKTVNEIYLNKVAQNIELDATDSAILDYISDLLLSQTGPAKYIAAGLLNKEVHEQAPNNQYRIIHTHHDDDVVVDLKQCGVYPNPANEKIYFVFNHNDNAALVLKIFDSSGKSVIEMRIKGLIQNIDCRVLGQGAYSYKILDIDKLVNTGKFSVIH